MGVITSTTAVIAMVAASAVAAAGSIASGIAAKRTGEAQADILRQEAERRDKAAKNRRKQGELDADEFRRRESRLLASQRAGFSASGVSLEGTPLLVGSDTAREVEFQAQKILNAGLIDASNIEAGATGLRSEAGIAQFQGSQALTGSFFRAGSTLLSGAARAGNFSGGGGPTVPGASSVGDPFAVGRP